MGKENRINLLVYLLALIMLVLIICAVEHYVSTIPSSFAYVEYGDSRVKVDTLTRVIYNLDGQALIDSTGKPLLYDGKFPWQ